MAGWTARRIVYLQRDPGKVLVLKDWKFGKNKNATRDLKKNGRSVANEAEVLAVLRNTTAEVDVLKNPNEWKADRAHIEKAHYIVGPHGGALANIMFASRGAVVLEFGNVGAYNASLGTLASFARFPIKHPHIIPRPHFLGLAAALGLTYHYIPVQDPMAFHYQKPMLVDITALASIFTRESAFR